jgi:uncharacterized protein
VIYDGPADAASTFVLAHGAGGAMDTPFLNTVARGMAGRGIRVVRFEFPYMAGRREGKRRGPDRQPVLLDTWRQVVGELGGGERLFIGGKSMGGRMATMVADELQVHGVICFGYPFHPPGKPQQLRTEHLETLRTPMLVLQGERDPFGTRDEVPGYPLAKTIDVEWIKDGDHSLRPRAASGTTEPRNLEHAIDLAVSFVTRRTSK